MERKALTLLIVCLVAIFIVAGCGGGSHTYVLTRRAPHAGVYVTIVSPVPLPDVVLGELKHGRMRLVDHAHGRGVCTYAKRIRPVEPRQYASLNGRTLVVKVNGSSSSASSLCSSSRLKRRRVGVELIEAALIDTELMGPTNRSVGPTGPAGPTGAMTADGPGP